ncbi:hypothetical protein C0431_14110 [bacterium]|nr:hypothetical protein [bacterium]
MKRLEFAPFAEFAEKLNDGSGYELEYDWEIGRRPVVWYFGKKSEHGSIELLKRSCSELYLNFDIDQERKRIFISGHSAATGSGLKGRISDSFSRFCKVFGALSRMSPDELEQLGVIDTESVDSLSDIEKQELLLRQSAIEALKTKAGRLFGSLVTGLNDDLFSRSVVGDYSSKNRLPLMEWGLRQVLKYVGSGEFAAHQVQGELESPEAFKKRVDAVKGFTGRGMEFWIRHKIVEGKIVILELLVTEIDRPISLVATLAVPIFQPASESHPSAKDIPDSLLNFIPQRKDQVFWGLFNVNAWQSYAIENDLNSVGWFDSMWTWPESRGNVRQHQKDFVNLAISEDGWLSVNRTGDEFPMLAGDWRGVERLYAGLKPNGATAQDVFRVLSEMPSDELDGMQTVTRIAGWGWEDSRVMDYVEGIARNGRMVRAGLREYLASGEKRVEKQVKFLKDESARDIGAVWFGALGDSSSFFPMKHRRGDYWLVVDRGLVEFSDPENALEAGKVEGLVVLLILKDGNKLLDRIGPVQIFLPREER